ncbi:MAG: hypothetical protein RL023_419 [Candidatus Parcubacteria bacterium]
MLFLTRPFVSFGAMPKESIRKESVQIYTIYTQKKEKCKKTLIHYFQIRQSHSLLHHFSLIPRKISLIHRSRLKIRHPSYDNNISRLSN